MWPGPMELILILLIVVVLFGSRKIPEIMGGLGKGIRSFKKAMDTDEPEPPSQPPVQSGQEKQETPKKPASP